MGPWGGWVSVTFPIPCNCVLVACKGSEGGGSVTFTRNCGVAGQLRGFARRGKEGWGGTYVRLTS